ncbi:MAG: hypothetical protein JXB49_06940 [Bacteroidales bacterium]|nr:hypothetical protein [Bacteroidales bacterium]
MIVTKVKIVKTVLSIILVAVSFNLSAQDTKSLKDILWEKATPCYEMFKDGESDEELKPDELIDDSKNGYLHISGSYPTCGCHCSVTAGAYKDVNGKYIVISTEEWTCSWTKKLMYDGKIQDILPEGFGMGEFIPGYTKSSKGQVKASFYLKMEIPRIGTDTKVKLETIPFGIELLADDELCYSYSEGTGNNTELYRLPEMAKNISDEKALEYFINSEDTKISTQDMTTIHTIIGKDNGQFKSEDELRAMLKKIRHTYDLYINLIYDAMVFG